MPSDPSSSSPRSCLGTILALAGIAVSAVMLLNFTWGGIVPLEIPDNLPIVGNLDEAAAAALLFSCLRYLGLDILPFGKRRAASRTESYDAHDAAREVPCREVPEEKR